MSEENKSVLAKSIEISAMDSAEQESREKLKGVVKWFNDAKGFGFIEHGSGRDVFVHYSVIVQEGFKTLEDGEEVEYSVEEGPKGLHAVRVSRTLKPEAEAAPSAIATEGSSKDAPPSQ